MKDFICDLNNEIRKSDSNMVLGTECAAAEPYVGELPFNDLRSSFACTRGMPVPAYEFVYHEYVNNFMGNQVLAQQYIDCKKSPENLLWRIAYSFNAGALLSVTLRDNGIIDWGAAADWNSEPPEQESVINLIRNLNNMRKKYPEFLRYGKMLKPLINIEGGCYDLHFVNHLEIIDAFTHSSWESPDGKKVQIVTNFLPQPQTIICHASPTEKIRIDSEMKHGDFEINIPPLNAVILNYE
jgi:hypothetical protein